MKDSIRNRLARRKGDPFQGRRVDVDLKELLGLRPKPLLLPNEFARQAMAPRDVAVTPQNVEELATILVGQNAEDMPATTFENGMYASTAGAFRYTSTKKRWNRKWAFRYPLLALNVLRVMAFVESTATAVKRLATKSLDKPAKRLRIPRRP